MVVKKKISLNNWRMLSQVLRLIEVQIKCGNDKITQEVLK